MTHPRFKASWSRGPILLTTLFRTGDGLLQLELHRRMCLNKDYAIDYLNRAKDRKWPVLVNFSLSAEGYTTEYAELIDGQYFFHD